MMRTGSESSEVGKIEILRDEDARGGLRGRPNGRVVMTTETLVDGGANDSTGLPGTTHAHGRPSLQTAIALPFEAPRSS